MASFDRFEFFQSLIYGDLNIEGSFGFWSPLGSFAWRRRDLFDRVRKDIKQAGQSWKPLQAGLFSRSAERATEIVDKLEEFTNRVRGQLGIW